MTKLDTLKPWMFIALFVSGLGLAACNTMEGAGEDMEAAGDAVSDEAEETEDSM